MASGHAEGKLTHRRTRSRRPFRTASRVALSGSGGGLIEADAIHAALERRFLATGHPRGLTLIHALGQGDAKERGLNRFAHEGMVARVIGGHWTWSPRMQALAEADAIEAYTLPAGRDHAAPARDRRRAARA